MADPQSTTAQLPEPPAQPVAPQSAQSPTQPLTQPLVLLGPWRPRRWTTGFALLVAVMVLLTSATLAWFQWFDQPKNVGASRPEVTVDKFLTAIFTNRDAATAQNLTCSAARDDRAIRGWVKQLREFDRGYQAPSYSWPSPVVESQHRDRATIFAQIRLITADDRVSWQRLRFLTIRDSGWLVCEINMA